MLDTKALAESTAAIIKKHVAAATEPLIKRIEELERLSPIAGKDGAAGRDGRDGVDGVAGKDGADGKDGAPGIDGKDGLDGKDGAPGKDGANGKDAEPVTDEQIAAVVAGMSFDDIIAASVEKHLSDNPPPAGKDGASVTVDDVRPLIEEVVQQHVDSVPLPKDGRDGADGKDGAPGRDGVDGKDGVSLAGEFITRDGVLVLTRSDGTTREVGVVVGRDGKDGIDGKDGSDGITGKDGSNGKDGLDGKDGAPGRDGIDGLNFEDFEVVENDAGLLVLRFARGDVAKEFLLPVQPYTGQWIEGSYVKSQSATHQGSLWIAMRDTDGRPGEKDSGWVLAVKRGRDGRESVPVAREKDKPVSL